MRYFRYFRDWPLYAELLFWVGAAGLSGASFAGLVGLAIYVYSH